MFMVKKFCKVISSFVIASSFMLGSGQAWGAVACNNQKVTHIMVHNGGGVFVTLLSGAVTVNQMLICNVTGTIGNINAAACTQRVKTFEMALLTGRNLDLYYSGTITTCPTTTWTDATLAPQLLTEVKIAQ